jgi:large conductance mechanosensitive channel
MPLIGIIIGGTDFSGLSITLGDAKIQYGLFIQNVVNLLIVAFCLFLIVKAMNVVKSKMEKPLESAPEKPAPKAEDIVLLEEIRDALVSLTNKE